MNTTLPLGLAILLGILIAGCGEGDTVTAGSTGVPFVDMVLDAIEANDQDTLTPLWRLEDTPCLDPRTAPTEITPLCKDGEEPGTLIRTFASESCIGLSRARANAEDLSEWIVGQNLALYAVYSAPVDHYLSARYVLVFGRPDGAGTPEVVRGFLLLLSENKIVGSDTDCGFPPSQLVEFKNLTEPILAPD